MNTSRARTLLLAAVALAVLAGCGGTPTVDRSDLEDTVSSRLEDMAGVAPDDVTCPGDLEGEEGTTMRCTLTAREDELGVTLTVTDVDGTEVGFDIEVDEMDGSGGGEPS